MEKSRRDTQETRHIHERHIGEIRHSVPGCSYICVLGAF